MREHVDALLDVEIKQSDELDILTFGSVGFEMWATFRVSTLAIPRRISVVVVSRHSVRKCHKSITALYEHAFPGAGTFSTTLSLFSNSLDPSNASRSDN